MDPITSILGFASGMKTAADITKTLFDLKLTGEVQAKVIELQSVIMSAQSCALEAQQEQFLAQSQIANLESEISRLKKMGDERAKYELRQVDSGCFAYMLSSEFRISDPPHWLCVPCFDSGYKNILQSTGDDGASRYRYTCPNCASYFAVRSRVSPAWLQGQVQ